MQFYVLHQTREPWGDYGDILRSGLCDREESSGILLLERTGPFVPPISFPGIPEIVVTDAFKKQLESSGLTGCKFLPVTKRYIAFSDWETWNTKKEPKYYPDSGEPEDYISEKPHSPMLAKKIGTLWELSLETVSVVDRKFIGYPEETDITLLESSWDGRDFFRAKRVGYNYITERAKVWLEQRVPEWVNFTMELSK